MWRPWVALVAALVASSAVSCRGARYTFHSRQQYGRTGQGRQQQHQQRQETAQRQLQYEGKNYYADLGLRKSASTEQVRKAYKKLAREWHPDRNTDPNAESRFMSINEAHEVLSDSKKRREYDSMQTGGFGRGFNRHSQHGFQYRQQQPNAWRWKTHRQEERYSSATSSALSIAVTTMFIVLGFYIIGPADYDDLHEGEEEPVYWAHPQELLDTRDIDAPNKPFVVILFARINREREFDEAKEKLRIELDALKENYRTDPVVFRVIQYVDDEPGHSRETYLSWLKFLLRAIPAKSAIYDEAKFAIRSPSNRYLELDAAFLLSPRKFKVMATSLLGKSNLRSVEIMVSDVLTKNPKLPELPRFTSWPAL